MATGVFTRDTRIRLVRGWLTGGTDPADGSVECGDGTRFPMLVTLDQLAEILFRVKDAWFIQGEYNGSNSYPGYTASYRITASTTAPSARVSYINSGSFQNRGYHANSSAVSVFSDPYLEAEYDDGSGGMFREISDNERAVLLEENDSLEEPFWNNHSTLLVTAFSTIQSNIQSLETSSDYFQAEYLDYFDPGPSGAGVIVMMSSQVAWVDVNGSGNPIDPLNKLYLGVQLQVIMDPSGGATPLIPHSDNSTAYPSPAGATSPIMSTYLPEVDVSLGGPATEECRYVLRLAPASIGGPPVDVSCPLYTDITGWGSTSMVDFIQQAQEWWPYAKAAGPCWSTATGTAL